MQTAGHNSMEHCAHGNRATSDGDCKKGNRHATGDLKSWCRAAALVPKETFDPPCAVTAVSQQKE